MQHDCSLVETNKYHADRSWRSIRFLWPCLCFLVIGLEHAAAEVSPDVELLVNKMIAVQSADQLKWSTATGSGVADFVSSTGSEQAVWDFEFRRDKRKVSFEYRLRRSDSQRPAGLDYDLVRLIADGDVVVTAKFSPRIHPTGCEAEMYLDTPQNFSMGHLGSKIDPRAYLLPPLMRGEKDLEVYRSDKATVTFDPRSEDRNTVLIAFEKGSFWRVRSAPELGNRIIRAEMGLLKEPDKPTLILEYHWRDQKDGFVPHEVVLQDFDYFRKEGYHVHRMILEKIADRFDPSEEEFTMAGLKLCERSRIIDRRPDAKVAVRSVNPDQLPVTAKEEGLVATVESLPDRSPPSKGGTNHPLTSNIRGWIIANLIFLVVVVVGWKLWKRS